MMMELLGVPKKSLIMQGLRWKHFFNNNLIPFAY